MTTTSTRIALLTPYGPADHVGGIETFNRQLQRALGNVETFAYMRQPRAEIDGPLDKIGLEHPNRAFRVARSFLRRHRGHPYGLVICNGIYGWPLSIIRPSIPMVQVYHVTLAGMASRGLPLRGDRFTTGTISAFFDGLAGRGKRVVAVNQSVLEEVRAYYRLDGNVIPNAIDTTLFRRLDKSMARKQLGLPDDIPIGLFVGRPEHVKGFDIFTRVAEFLQDIVFVVVGPCREVGPNVRVLESMPHSKMPLCYSAADFFFLPSRYEGFNLSILEAMACELPLVISQAAYPLAQEPSRFGRVVMDFGVQEFAQAVREVLDRGPSRAARETVVAEYSMEIFQRNWRRLVEDLFENDDR